MLACQRESYGRDSLHYLTSCYLHTKMVIRITAVRLNDGKDVSFSCLQVASGADKKGSNKH